MNLCKNFVQTCNILKTTLNKIYKKKIMFQKYKNLLELELVKKEKFYIIKTKFQINFTFLFMALLGNQYKKNKNYFKNKLFI